MSSDAHATRDDGSAFLGLLRAAVSGRAPAAAPDDWPSLLQQAVRQEVDAFLYPAVASWPATWRPPDALLQDWRQRFAAAAGASVYRELQTGELLSALADAGLRAVPLKGIWLSANVYTHPAQRPMCDIDLLVAEPQLDPARAVLERLGYTTRNTCPSDRFEYTQAFRSARYAWPVELHWRMGFEPAPQPRPQPDPPGRWQRVAAGELFGVPTPVLGLEDQLAVLVGHVLHHSLALPLRALLDIALLVQRRGGACDSARLSAAAEEWGVTHAMPRLVRIAAELFDVGLPPPLDAWAPDVEPEARRQAASALLAASEERVLEAEPTLLEWRRKGRLAGLGLVLRRIFLPRELLRIEYPSARVRIGLPVAYVQRAIDLVRRRRADLWRLMRQDPGQAHQLDLAQARQQTVRWLAQGGEIGTVAERKPGRNRSARGG